MLHGIREQLSRDEEQSEGTGSADRKVRRGNLSFMVTRLSSHFAITAEIVGDQFLNCHFSLWHLLPLTNQKSLKRFPPPPSPHKRGSLVLQTVHIN